MAVTGEVSREDDGLRLPLSVGTNNLGEATGRQGGISRSEGREKLQKSLKKEERVPPGHGNPGHRRTGYPTLSVSALETCSQ